MKAVSLNSLTNELAKPGFERELIPLLMYKGHSNLGRYQRMWNLTVAAMMHEAESISEAVNHLHLNDEWSHLCFPEHRLAYLSMYSFLSRLSDNPQVSDLVPGLTDYVGWLLPKWGGFNLQRVSIESSRARCAWWRTFTPFVPLSQRPPDGFAATAAAPAHVLADLYNVSPYIVRKWKDLLGIEQYRPLPTEVPADFEEVAGVEYNDVLMSRYGVSYPVLNRWRKEAGIRSPRKPGALLPPPDDFYEVANGQSLMKVAAHYGRSFKLISRWYEETGAARIVLARAELAYPFILHEAKRPQHELLLLINEAIPKWLPPDLRADMCQDLAVGILTGDFSKDDLRLPAKEVAKRVHRMFPTKYGPLSLDAIIPGTEDLKLLDTLIDEGRDWA